MAFKKKRYPTDPYDRPDQPHHIHKAGNCQDHRDCPSSHWIGGRPETEWPHHVEIDLSTGLIGYTRLTEEEIRDLEMLREYEADHNLREKP